MNSQLSVQFISFALARSYRGGGTGCSAWAWLRDINLCVTFVTFLTSANLIFWPFQVLNWQPPHRLLLLWRTFTPILVFVRVRVRVLELGARRGQTDRPTDGRSIPVTWSIGRPHNKCSENKLGLIQAYVLGQWGTVTAAGLHQFVRQALQLIVQRRRPLRKQAAESCNCCQLPTLHKDYRCPKFQICL